MFKKKLCLEGKIQVQNCKYSLFRCIFPKKGKSLIRVCLKTSGHIYNTSIWVPPPPPRYSGIVQLYACFYAFDWQRLRVFFGKDQLKGSILPHCHPTWWIQQIPMATFSKLKHQLYPFLFPKSYLLFNTCLHESQILCLQIIQHFLNLAPNRPIHNFRLWCIVGNVLPIDGR